MWQFHHQQHWYLNLFGKFLSYNQENGKSSSKTLRQLGKYLIPRLQTAQDFELLWDELFKCELHFRRVDYRRMKYSEWEDQQLLFPFFFTTQHMPYGRVQNLVYISSGLLILCSELHLILKLTSISALLYTKYYQFTMAFLISAISRMWRGWYARLPFHSKERYSYTFARPSGEKSMLSGTVYTPQGIKFDPLLFTVRYDEESYVWLCTNSDPKALTSITT